MPYNFVIVFLFSQDYNRKNYMKGIEEVTVQRVAGRGMVIFGGTLSLREKSQRY